MAKTSLVVKAGRKQRYTDAGSTTAVSAAAARAPTTASSGSAASACAK